MNNYSIYKVRQMYEEYFDMLLKLKFDEGFTLENPGRQELDWLYKDHPDKSKIIQNNTKKSKILIFTETKWAFGRIFQAIQKYSNKLDIDILSWENGIPNKSKLDLYDLIYTTVWDIGRQLEVKYPDLKDKITFSGHGKVDFLKMNFDDPINHKIEEENINSFKTDPKLISWLKNRKLGFSVVSHELYDLLTSEPYNLVKNDQIYLTQCGVDDEIFSPVEQKFIDNSSKSPLKVIYGLPSKSTTQMAEKSHGYDAKRKWLVEKIIEKLQKEPGNNI